MITQFFFAFALSKIEGAKCHKFTTRRMALGSSEVEALVMRRAKAG